MKNELDSLKEENTEADKNYINEYLEEYSNNLKDELENLKEENAESQKNYIDEYLQEYLNNIDSKLEDKLDILNKAKEELDNIIKASFDELNSNLNDTINKINEK